MAGAVKSEEAATAANKVRLIMGARGSSAAARGKV
jgi:hypothetical protein